MKDKGNERQWFAQAKRRQGFNQLPFPFAALRHAACILAVREELPDFDLIRPVSFRFVSRGLRRDELQDAKLLDFFRDERIRFRSWHVTDFLEDDQREDIAAINPFRVPVDDVFSGVGDGIGALLRFLVPIYQRAGTTDIDDFSDEFFREGSQAGPQHVGIFNKFRERSADAGAGVRQFEGWIAAKNQSDETIRRAGGGVEKGSTIFVGEIFLVVLTIQTRQIFFSRRLDGILTGENISRTQPGRQACVVISMCGVNRHRRTIARHFDVTGAAYSHITNTPERSCP